MLELSACTAAGCVLHTHAAVARSVAIEADASVLSAAPVTCVCDQNTCPLSTVAQCMIHMSTQGSGMHCVCVCPSLISCMCEQRPPTTLRLVLPSVQHCADGCMLSNHACKHAHAQQTFASNMGITLRIRMFHTHVGISMCPSAVGMPYIMRIVRAQYQHTESTYTTPCA